MARALRLESPGVRWNVGFPRQRHDRDGKIVAEVSDPLVLSPAHLVYLD